MILLTSENFVKSISNIDDNIQGSYLSPAIREAQEVDLESILGYKLTKKLQDLVSGGTIESEENVHYKELLDKAQYFLAYSAIVKIILICSVKLSNMGASQANDDNIKTLSLDEVLQLQDIYQNKADFYCKMLQKFILDNKGYFPELNENNCYQTKANLYSAASSGVFLGGQRGKNVPFHRYDITGGNGSSGGGGGGTTNYNALQNKPQINDIELQGNKTLSELGIQPAGNYTTKDYVDNELDAVREDISDLQGEVEGKASKSYVNNAIASETARTEATYIKEHQSLADYATTAVTTQLATEIAGKQNTLTAGSNISISGNVISATDTTYSAGTGIEISGNTINCTVSGGGGECNYHIVQDLSAITAPTEGTMAYVNSGIGIDTWEGYSFDGSSISEGYVVSINKPNVGNINIYRSGTNFYWDWENDEQLHKKSVNNISVLYQAFQNGTFKIAIEDWTDISINVENGVTSATTSLTYSYDVYAQSYLYENSSWNKAYLLSYNFSNMTNAQIGQVISKMLADNENNRCVYNIYYDGYKLLYKYTETSKIWFTGTKTDVWSSDKIKLIQVTFNISGERGDYEEYSNGLGGPAGLQINTSTHNAFWIGNSFPVSGLQNGEKNKSFIAYGGDNNPSSEGTYSSGHYQFKTCDTWVKEYWDEDESRWRLGEFVGAIGAHFYYRDKEVYAEWKFVENTITNIKWTETTVS